MFVTHLLETKEPVYNFIYHSQIFDFFRSLNDIPTHLVNQGLQDFPCISDET